MSQPRQKPRTVTFKAMYWYYKEELAGPMIYISGLTAKLETVFIKVIGYTPSVCLELPRSVKWDAVNISHLVNRINNYIYRTESKIISFKPKVGQNIYELKKERLLELTVHSQSAVNALKTFGGKTINIKGINDKNGVKTFQPDEFKIHEAVLDPIIKFTAFKSIDLSGWIQVTEYISVEDKFTLPEDRKFATTDIDMFVKAENVVKTEITDLVYPMYCSFDIECYSHNHDSKLPDFTHILNEIFQIAVIFGRVGKTMISTYLLTLHNPKNIKGVKVRRFDTEGELLIAFSELVIRYDPDLFYGYNTMKFDWNYMIERAKIRNILGRFMMMSRLINVPADLANVRWTSSAYSDQIFSYPECHGRVQFDVLVEVERNHRLPIYSLNAVSMKFLNDSKDDITPRELFMFYKITKDLLKLVPKGERVRTKTLLYVKERIQCIMPIRKTHGVAREHRNILLTSTPENIRENIRECLTLTGKYCVQDTILPIRLSDRLNLVVSFEQNSNVMGVPMSYIQTKGQQIKVLSQVYRSIIGTGIFIPKSVKSNAPEGYKGAIVVEAIKGHYKWVSTLDFASLYPTIIISANICYTTYIQPDDPIPDSETNVIMRIEHVNCSHDPKAKSGKKVKILCGEYKHRFRRVKLEYNEETGEIIRHHEGVLPRIERNLLYTRSQIKKEMFKVEAMIKLHEGVATEDDLAYYRKVGIPMIEKGSLSAVEYSLAKISWAILNARQLAVKVAANSTYGITGAQKGYLPFIKAAASICSLGRSLLTHSVAKVKSLWDFVELIYGDTDSCMIRFRGKTLKECYFYAREASKKVTHFLKCMILNYSEDDTVTLASGEKKLLNTLTQKSPEFKELSYPDKIKILNYESIPIDLEFENMYGEFVLLSKKRYFATKVTEDGTFAGTTEKGIVLARRDNCKYLRDTYREMKDQIINNQTEQEIMWALYENIHKMFTMRVPDESLIIYMGVKSLLSYAKRDEIVDEHGNIDYVYHQISSKELLSSKEITTPLDPRILYKNLPQGLLSLKMWRRGTEIPPNTRLEFLYIENPNATHQGHKAEDFAYFSENKDIENLVPDKIHYIEKQLSKPITELVLVKFPREIVLWEELSIKFNRLLHSKELSSSKKFILNSTLRKRDCILNENKVGWEAIGAKVPYIRPAPRTYKSSRITSEVDKIVTILVDSMKRHSLRQEGFKNEFSRDSVNDKEFINTALQLKSRMLLDTLHKKYHAKKRTHPKPKIISQKLRIKSKVVLLTSHGQFPKGSRGRVITIYEKGSDGSENILTNNKRPVKTLVNIIPPPLSKKSTRIVPPEPAKKIVKIKVTYEYTFDILMKSAGGVTKTDGCVANTGGACSSSDISVDAVNPNIITGVKRENITTFRLRDDKFMSDIVMYRRNYQKVVSSMRKYFEKISTPKELEGGGWSMSVRR